MRVVILISGRGSNMKALLETCFPADAPVQFACVISNKVDAAGLQTAVEHGVPTEVLDHRPFSNRADFDQALAQRIDAYQPDIVILAGFMRVLTEDFVRHYENRLVNVHPALLPAFPGLDTHARAIAAGVKLHGCTVHFVTPEVDAGPIIAQAAVPVLADDTPDRLAARVLRQEHQVFPMVVGWLAQGRVRVCENGTVSVSLDPLTDLKANAEAVLISPFVAPVLPAARPG
jgi:phosphoribosylglycinamide formyltransferase-1